MSVPPIAAARYVCDCCQRVVDYVRGSIWHAESRICRECFYEWYDPTGPEDFDRSNPVALGNHVRKKHGLPPLANDGGRRAP